MVSGQRLRLLLALLTGLLGAAAAAADVTVAERALPGLEGILRGAAQQSPRMLGRTLDLEIAEANREAARAGLLPSLTASYRYYQAQDDRADQNRTLGASKIYYDVTLTQPLFHWGERRNDARIGEIRGELARSGYQEAYRALGQELRQRYLALIVQKLQVARSRGGLELALARLREGEEQLAARRLAPSAVQTQRIGVEQARLALERVEFDFAAAKASFARLAGLAAFDDAQIPDEVPAVRHDQAAVDRLVAAFTADPAPATPETSALRRQREIEELTLANHRTRLRPKVNAVAGVMQDEQSYSLNTAARFRVLSAYAGVAVNWTIFDGHAARAAVRSSRARLRQMELDSAEAVERLRQQARAQAKHVDFAARFMAMADQALDATQGSLRLREEELRQGTAAAADVEVARLQLAEARIVAWNARSDYLLRVSELLGTVAQDPVTTHLEIPR